MKAIITFEIECGVTTCASEPGKFCQFLRAQLNGRCSCFLFGKLWDTAGWVQRHPDCLKTAHSDKLCEHGFIVSCPEGCN